MGRAKVQKRRSGDGRIDNPQGAGIMQVMERLWPYWKAQKKEAVTAKHLMSHDRIDGLYYDYRYH